MARRRRQRKKLRFKILKGFDGYAFAQSRRSSNSCVAQRWCCFFSDTTAVQCCQTAGTSCLNNIRLLPHLPRTRLSLPSPPLIAFLPQINHFQFRTATGKEKCPLGLLGACRSLSFKVCSPQHSYGFERIECNHSGGYQRVECLCVRSFNIWLRQFHNKGTKMFCASLLP